MNKPLNSVNVWTKLFYYSFMPKKGNNIMRNLPADSLVWKSA